MHIFAGNWWDNREYIMQYIKKPFISATKKEIDFMSLSERQEYKKFANYVKSTANVEHWDHSDFEMIINRESTLFDYENLVQPYVFVAHSPKDVENAYHRFIDGAPGCKFFEDNISFEDEEYDDLDLDFNKKPEKTLQSGFLVDFNPYSNKNQAVKATAYKGSIDTGIYVGKLEFPCIISVWMAGQGYGRKLDGTCVVTLNDLRVSKFSELDRN